MQSSKALSIKPADIIVIVALLWVVGGTYFIAFRLANGLHDKMTTLHKDQAQETALRVKEKNLSELATAFSEHQTELDRLKVAYPNEEQAAEAMIEIQTMAAQAGVTVSSLTPSHGSADALPVHIKISIVFSMAFMPIFDRSLSRMFQLLVVRPIRLVRLPPTQVVT